MTFETSTMESITSTDGVKIAYWKTGHGPPLVLVHGSISDRTTWALVQPALEQRFTVYAVNRRRREGSPSPKSHTLEQEYEDVANIVDAIGEPAHLLGHSFGAVCSLGATKLSERVRSLILYEPPMLGSSQNGVISDVRRLARDGRDDDALAVFLSTAIQLSGEEIGRMRESPIWPGMVAHVANLVEEINASADYTFDANQFAGLEIPVLLLVGAASPPRSREINEALAKVLPNARLRALSGQGHVAQLAAPDLFLSEVLSFLESVEA